MHGIHIRLFAGTLMHIFFFLIDFFSTDSCNLSMMSGVKQIEMLLKLGLHLAAIFKPTGLHLA